MQEPAAPVGAVASAATGASRELLAEGAVVLRGFARLEAASLVAAVAKIAAISPFRQMTTPGGFRMSVAMTNCGAAGWSASIRRPGGPGRRCRPGSGLWLRERRRWRALLSSCPTPA
jgi:alkylated DNA repair protein (DNA oxidative demethylase)